MHLIQLEKNLSSFWRTDSEKIKKKKKKMPFFFFRNTHFEVIFDNSSELFFSETENKKELGFFALPFINQEAYF